MTKIWMTGGTEEGRNIGNDLNPNKTKNGKTKQKNRLTWYCRPYVRPTNYIEDESCVLTEYYRQVVFKQLTYLRPRVKGHRTSVGGLHRVRGPET